MEFELLFVGDSKMSALAIRAHIHQLNQHYLCPLALTGNTAEEMIHWIEAAKQWYIRSASGLPGERKG